MALHERQVTESQRGFQGPRYTGRLVLWLNETKNQDAKTRVLNLHALLYELVRTSTQKDNPDPHDSKSPWNKLRKRINGILMKYPVCAQLAWFRYGFFTKGYIPLVKGKRRENDGLTETAAVFILLELFEDQTLWWRLKQCTCGTYYFRRFRHQRFCSESCRVKEFRSADEWKAHRRKKAREYYWLHKNKNVR